MSQRGVADVGGTYHDHAVVTRRIFKSIGGNSVLKGTSISVPSGVVYGLIGPSGCGKTTLLNIIIGRLQPDSGDVKTKVTKLSQIGYMPQELALCLEFTIEETLIYFGLLYGLSREEINHKLVNILNFLILPHRESFISSLSGGQQRTVSLAVALIHQPDLLILDEPTVGVDPVLSAQIWDSLVNLSKRQNKSIIITTHYIEAVKAAHRVGMMRDGKILLEGNPSQLMEQYNSESLENVFLMLSQQSERIKQEVEAKEVHPEIFKKPVKRRLHLSGDNKFKTTRLSSLMMKHIYWIRRNPLVALFVTLLPVVLAVSERLAIGGDPKGISLLVVNDEVSHWQTSCKSTNFTGCSGYMLSCHFLDLVKNKGIILEDANNVFEAVARAKTRHDVSAVMHFRQNFSSTLLERVSLLKYASTESIDLSEIHLFPDNTKYIISVIIKNKLVQSFVEFNKKLHKECDFPEKLADIPIRFNEPVFGKLNYDFSFSSAPSSMIMFMFFFPLVLTVSSILGDRFSGLWDRTMVAGTNEVEMVGASLVLQIPTVLLQVSLIVYIEFFLFDSPSTGGYLLVINLLLLTACCGIFFGLLVALIINSFFEGAMLLLGIYFTSLLTGGTVWPVEGIHKSVSFVYYVFPLNMAAQSLRAIIHKPWSFTHPAICSGFLGTFAYLLLFIILSLFTAKLQRWGFNTSIMYNLNRIFNKL